MEAADGMAGDGRVRRRLGDGGDCADAPGDRWPPPALATVALVAGGARLGAWHRADGGAARAAAAAPRHDGRRAAPRPRSPGATWRSTPSSTARSATATASDAVRARPRRGHASTRRLPGRGRHGHRPGPDAWSRSTAEPVPLLFGDRPLWRDARPGVDDGADVDQLEANLVALGVVTADELTVDQDWTSATTDAVEDWQESLGREETGAVAPGDVVFLPGRRPGRRPPHAGRRPGLAAGAGGDGHDQRGDDRPGGHPAGPGRRGPGGRGRAARRHGRRRAR